jgi:hypothetical protein
MLHKDRVWYVTDAECAAWLAHQLTQCTWCGCNGFRRDKYVFVNDATSPDGAQEYAVLRPEGNHFVQIESVTFSWMTEEKAFELIGKILAAEFDCQVFSQPVDRLRLQTPEEHRRCYLCA